MKMRIEDLIRCFECAKKNGSKYVGVKIQTEGYKKEEIIINPRENFDMKLDYYKQAYNEDLTLKSAPHKIRIVSFTFANTYEEVAKDLLCKRE